MTRLLALMLVAAPALADRAELSVIGWSPDETAFAVRVYNHFEPGPGGAEAPIECAAYVDHRGEKFQGSLKIVLYAVGEAPREFPVQDWFSDPAEPCTDAKVAKERLELAKDALEARGVVRDRVGKPFSVEKKWTVPVTVKRKQLGLLEMQEKVSEHAIDGSKVSFEKQGKRNFLFRATTGDTEKFQLFRRPWSHKYSKTMGGRVSVETDHVFLSPSGKTVVVFEEVFEGSLRERRSTINLVLVGSWDGGRLTSW